MLNLFKEDVKTFVYNTQPVLPGQIALLDQQQCREQFLLQTRVTECLGYDNVSVDYRLILKQPQTLLEQAKCVLKALCDPTYTLGVAKEITAYELVTGHDEQTFEIGQPVRESVKSRFQLVPMKWF